MYTFDDKNRSNISIKRKRSFKETASMFEFIVVYFPLLLIVVLGVGFAIWFLLTLWKKPDEDFEEDET